MKVECPHCHAKVGTSRLRGMVLTSYPPIYETYCPVCDKLIESRCDRESYEIDLSGCTVEPSPSFIPMTGKESEWLEEKRGKSIWNG